MRLISWPGEARSRLVTHEIGTKKEKHPEGRENVS